MKLIFRGLQDNPFLIYNWENIPFLTTGRIYDGDLTPIIYDPNTLNKRPPSYIVRCDDGKCRKVDAKFFIPQDEHRGKQLSDILDL